MFNGQSFSKEALQRFGKTFVRSIWLFPAILTLPLISLTALGISGTSTGTYNNVFYGDKTEDPALIKGEPRPVRSDEWLVNSQLTVAQAEAGFPRVNKNLGNGQDMSMVVDAPYKDWSVVFKPHNLAYFALPFDNAFAFKWWFTGYLLILSCYFFVITLAPKKRLWATFISLAIFFNPFVQWWYLSGTMAPIYFSLFAATIVIRLYEAKSKRQMWLWGTLLAYVITCFAMILYPPFQVPCAIALGGFVVGYLFHMYRTLPWSVFFSKLTVVGVAVLVAGAIAFTFLQTRRDIVSVMQGTVYPGRRIATSGMNLVYEKTFSAPLSFGLQNEQKGANYSTNYFTSQSEAATFIKLNFIFAPVVLLLIYRKTRLRGALPYYLFWATSAATLLLVVRIFTPFFDLPFRALLLNLVPNERLEIGLLLLTIIQISLLGCLLASAKQELVSKKVALVTATVGFALFLDTSISMAQKFPLFIVNRNQIILMVIAVGITIYLLLRKRTYVWGLVLFLAINVVSSIGVNPLYTRPQEKALASVTEHIRIRYPNDGKKWAVFDQLITENVPAMADKPALTGVFGYPQLELWKRIDNKGESEEYNRYAHTVFTVSKTADGGHFTNPSPDVLLVSFDCDVAKKLPRFGYVLSAQRITDPDILGCLNEKEKLVYPNLVLYIYTYSARL